MISMTGFGRAVASQGGRRLAVEIRSVNHRSVDIKVRGRDIEAACEVEMIRAVRAAVERGAVTVSLRDDSTDANLLNLDRLRSLHNALATVRQELGITQEVDLATLAAFLAEGRGGVERAPDWTWETVRPAVLEALAALGAMRAREGAVLAADMGQRLVHMENLSKQIQQGTASLPAQAARRLRERVLVLADLPVLDPSRIAQETAFLAEKLDVSEETVRLDAHLAHLRSLLAEGRDVPTAAGRKIDFVIQEVGRELNTIASKVQDAGIATLVIDGKAELEKIREQAQNIE